MEQMFDQDAWSRSNQSQEEQDRGLVVTFYVDAKPYKENGETKYKNVEMINIFTNKNNIVDKPLNDEDRKRFAKRYAEWKETGETPPDGTPLTEWPELTPADIKALQAERILTVEMLAEKADNLMPSFLLSQKYKARDWLDSRHKAGVLSDLRDQIMAKDAVIETLREKLSMAGDTEGLLGTIDTLKAEIESLKSVECRSHAGAPGKRKERNLCRARCCSWPTIPLGSWATLMQRPLWAVGFRRPVATWRLPTMKAGLCGNLTGRSF